MAIKVSVSHAAKLPVIVAQPSSDKDLVALRSVYGIKKATNTNLWVAPGFYPFGVWVVNDLRELSKSCTILMDSSVAELESSYQDTVNSIGDGDLAGYTPVTTPYAHQVEALSYAIHTPRAGLFLDPGLGKTKVACDVILHQRQKNPGDKFLVVALRVNLKTWEREMLVHSGGSTSLLPIQATGGKDARVKKISKALADPTCAGIVVTYDTCRVSKEELLKYPYSHVILDESHSLRGATSGRTKSVLELVNKPGGVYRRLLLSGTPALGSPLHMWGQLRALGDFAVPNYWSYMAHYCEKSPYNKHIILGYRNLGELNDLVTSVSIRKTAEECLDLPERTFQVVEVDPEPGTRKVYNQIASSLKESTPVTVGGMDLLQPENQLTVLTRLSQVSMGFAYKSNKNPRICDSCPKVAWCVTENIKPYTGKCTVVQQDPGNQTAEVGTTEVLDSVMELVESHVQAGKKVIVWARHRWVLDSLARQLDKLLGSSSKVFRYDSTTQDPSAVELAFNAHPGACVIVGQISMGIGVTFKAPVMVYAEVSWALDHWLQSMDRNYGLRAAGFSKLLVQAVVLKDSVSQITLDLLNQKVDVSSLISKRVECAACPKAAECLAKGIMPFDSDCILDSKGGTKASLSIRRI